MVTSVRENIVSARLVAALVIMLAVLLPICASVGQAADVARGSAQSPDKGSAIPTSANGQMNPGSPYEEDLVAGMRLKSSNGRLVVVPFRGNSTLQNLRRDEQSYSRSMHSINNSIREMRNSLNQIRTYQRLFR